MAMIIPGSSCDWDYQSCTPISKDEFVKMIRQIPTIPMVPPDAEEDDDDDTEADTPIFVEPKQ